MSALCGCALSVRSRGGIVAYVLIGAALGCACSGAASYRLMAQTDALLARAEGEFRFRVYEDAEMGSYGPQCLCEELQSGALVRLSLPDEYATLRYGDRFTAKASFRSASERASSAYWRAGYACMGRADGIVVAEREGLLAPLLSVRNRVLDALFAQDPEGEPGLVSRALLCGYRSGLASTPIYLAFQTDGLAHMVAISGAHLSLVCGVIAACLTRLRVSRRCLCIVELVAVGCYLVIAAAPISALRAAVMVCAALMSFFANRRGASMNALGLSMIALLTLHPHNALSVSFALSVFATFGIIVFFPLVSEWLASWVGRLPAAIRDSLALTLTANLCTIPLSAAMFCKLSLISPFANCICAPILLVVCTLGCVTVLASVIIPPLAPFGFAAVDLCSTGFCWVVHAISKIPYACIVVSASLVGALLISALACAALWLLWPRFPLRIAVISAACMIAAAIAFFLIMQLSVGTRIVMLDVGQGDAFLIQSEGRSMLIDTGNEQRLLQAALAKQGVLRLDCVLISHSDDDHCGCLRELCSCVRVDSIALDVGAFTCACRSCSRLRMTARELVGEAHVLPVDVGDTVHCGDFALSVIWPDAYEDKGGNADSMCLLAHADVDHDGSFDCAALFCGDAEAEQLTQLLNEKRVGRIDILKVGHHGARVALDERVISALSPSVALISVGKYNAYGHPAEQTLDLLDGAGARVFRTDRDGSVICRIESADLTITAVG